MAKWYHTFLPPNTKVYKLLFDFYFYNIKDVRGKLKQQINAVTGSLKVDLGAGKHTYEGWIATDYPFFDITNRQQWDYLFADRKADNFLSEHVLEHLTYNQVERTIENVARHLKPGGCYRVAIPDAFHPSKEYVEWSKPGEISDDHKIFWDHASLSKIFERHGFRVDLIEYYTYDGKFMSKDFSYDNGFILRSKTKNYEYKGFYKGEWHLIEGFSSLIIDAYKL